MKNRNYGELSRMMVIDALCGSDFDVTRQVMAKLVETGFMVPEPAPGRGDDEPLYVWNRHKLGDLTTDTLVDLYISMKNTEAPRVLS